MKNKEFSILLEKRTLKFGVNIIHLSTSLPNTTEGKVIKNQLTKSGTSIGANYREANRARSKADFRNKIKICESEASETLYWLDLVIGANILTRACKKLCVNGHCRLQTVTTGGTNGHTRRPARCPDEGLQESRRPHRGNRAT
jgi:four helix bundle protein